MYVTWIYLGTKEATLNPLWNKMAEQGEREANKERNSMDRGSDISFLEGSINKTIFMTPVALARQTRARLIGQCCSGHVPATLTLFLVVQQFLVIDFPNDKIDL